LWRTAFNADADIVGRAIRLDGGLVTVVGVMPPRFDADAAFWVPLSHSLAGFARDDRQFTLFARLAERTSMQDASRELADISARLAADHTSTNQGWTTFPTALTRMHGRDSRGAFLMLQGAVAFVLLIACANIANLLLARGAERRTEMAVRVALGAGRGRMLSALLVESLLLSLTGGALGVLLSIWGIRLARIIGGFPDVIDPALNTIVLGFTASVSMLTGVVSGIVPALKASSVAPESVLRAGPGRGGSGRAQGWLRTGLVVAQIAGALVLATCGMLMLQTLANRQRMDLGFDPSSAIRADLLLAGERYRDVAAVRTAAAAILDRLRSQPEVRVAGISTWALPTGAGGQRQLTLPAQRDLPLNPSIRRGIEAITPLYLEALGAPLKAGRAFDDADRAGTEPVALVNEELARHFWLDRSPVGEQLRLGSPAEDAPIVTIVGVVGTIRRSAMHDVVVARVYVPYAQYPNATMSIVVRGRGDAASTGRALQGAVAAVDPSLLLEGLRTVETDLAQFIAPIRLITWLLTGFGVAGVLLSGLGVFGTMSYTVSQRQREMAVRSALGAGRRDIFRLVLGSALSVTAIGILAGLAASLAATRALASFVFGVSPTDPLTLSAVAVFLTLVSLGACYRPARKAATVDPMSLLRQ
jgi:predicted permease